MGYEDKKPEPPAGQPDLPRHIRRAIGLSIIWGCLMFAVPLIVAATPYIQVNPTGGAVIIVAALVCACLVLVFTSGLARRAVWAWYMAATCYASFILLTFVGYVFLVEYTVPGFPGSPGLEVGVCLFVLVILPSCHVLYHLYYGRDPYMEAAGRHL